MTDFVTDLPEDPPPIPLTPEEERAQVELWAKIAASRLERHGQPEPKWPDDVLLPDLSSGSHSESAEAVNKACDSISILEVYEKKSKGQYDDPRQKHRRTEGIQISCPIPGHADLHPSAAINRIKEVWNCYRCDVGGNKYTIAGYAYGLDPKTQFWDIKVRMAKELRGVDYEKPTRGASTALPTTQPRQPQVASQPGTTVPSYKIQDVLPDGDSFLRSYYDATVVDETPSEYQLWCGLAALAAAIGRNVTMLDSRPITANLGICLIGSTASGKSRSMRHVEELLEMDSRLQWKSGNVSGIKFRENPGSGPYLIGELVDIEKTTSGEIQHPVKMLILQDEISSLVRKGNSRDNNHGVREVLLQLLDGKRRLHHGSKTGGNAEALDSFAVLLGATQPEIVPNLFSNEDMVTGFMNRLIFIPGQPVKRSHRASQAIDLSIAEAHLKHIVGWAAKGIEIDEWADDADALWKDSFDRRVEPMQNDPRMRSLLGRLDLNLKRLILLFAANERSSSIELQHVQSVVALIDYLLECYSSLMEHLETTDVDRAWISIAKACLRLQQSGKYEGHAPTSQLQRTVGIRYWKAVDYRQAIEAMVEAELVEIYDHTRQGGTTARCFRLTDSGLELAS